MQARRIVISLVLAGVALLVGAGMCILIDGRTETNAAILTAGLGWLLICASQALSALSRRRG
jgi:hypothetical protein